MRHLRQQQSLRKKWKKPRCPDHSREMYLEVSRIYTDRRGQPKKTWKCLGIGCYVNLGAHPDGRPVGRVVDQETRQLRILAHAYAAKIWGTYNLLSFNQRNRMYAWLKVNSKKGHFGKMRKDELLEVIDKMKIKCHTP